MFVRKSTFDAVVAELAELRADREVERDNVTRLLNVITKQSAKIQKLESARKKGNANLKQYRKGGK